MRLETQQAHDIARRAAIKAGASNEVADALAQAVVSAELAGSRAVGFAHLPDYLDGFAKGRIAKDVKPEVTFPAPAAIAIDAKYGIAQLGFDLAFDELVQRARTYGVTLLLQSNSFTVGELGYYTRRLAEAGLVAIATTNATAQMTTLESRKAVYGTNPLSFSAPRAGARPFVIDQASSATAFVNVRQAAERGDPIPEGWAVDAQGNPTTDAREAVKGLLLAFGGARGANIAMMLEFLVAGLAGSNWSMDAPGFAEGSESPGVGLFVVAIKPDLVVEDFAARLSSQIERLAAQGVRIPGSHLNVTEIDVPEELLKKLEG